MWKLWATLYKMYIRHSCKVLGNLRKAFGVLFFKKKKNSAGCLFSLVFFILIKVKTTLLALFDCLADAVMLIT